MYGMHPIKGILTRENFCGKIKQIQFKLDLRHQNHSEWDDDDE